MVGRNTPVIELMHRPIDDSTWKDIILLFVFSNFSIMISVVKFNYCIVISRVHTMIPRHFLKSMHNAHEPFMMNHS